MNKKHLLAATLATLSLNTFAAAPDSTAADKEAAPSQWHIIGETENRGLRYLYIEMPRPKNRTGFIAQVGEIHAAEPDAWLIILAKAAAPNNPALLLPAVFSTHKKAPLRLRGRGFCCVQNYGHSPVLRRDSSGLEMPPVISVPSIEHTELRTCSLSS